MILNKKIIYLFAIIALLAMSLSATEYYVKNGGNDAASGLDDDNAWETIAKVNGESFSGDDIIYFKRGDTWREQLTPPDSGTSGHQITFGAYGEGADPIINGSDLVATWTQYGVWSTDWSISPSSNSSGAGDFQTRTEWDCGTTGTKIRITLNAADGAAAEIDGTGIGPQSGSTDDYTEAGTRITWDTDSNTTTVDAGSTKTSDDITFSCTNGTSYLVNVFYDDTKSYKYMSTSGNQFFEPDAGQTDQSVIAIFPYTSESGVIVRGLEKIEVYSVGDVWQATLTTEPNQVFFDGTRGTKQASAAACTGAGHWYWAANVLYVYYTEDPDGAVVIEASVREEPINIGGHDYITVDGITVKYSSDNGIQGMASNNFIIKNCTISYSYDTNIMVWGTAAQITSGLIQNCTASYALTGQGILIACDENGPNGITIENNTVNNNGSASGDNGIYLDQANSNIIRYNLIYSNYDNNVQFQYGSDSNQFYYNTIDSAVAGVGLWMGSGDGGSSNLVYNNVFYNNFGNAIKFGAGTSNVIKNNIMYQPSGGSGYNPCLRFATETLAQGQTIDYNRYYYPGADVAEDIVYIHDITTNYNITEWKAYTGSPDAHSTEGNPLMTDPSSDDFTLQVGSPCINRGIFVGLLLDYLGLPVPIGHRPDIGAYEHKNGGAVIH